MERVVYTPSSPGASAKPFAGIAPAGEWPVDEFGRRYAEFPCHYVEYAFSQYAAQIFPNAPNAGADAAYPNSGEWERVITPGDYGSGFGYGKTQCTGSTEAECQPCLAYPSQYWYNVGPPPSGDPLPTLAQLQKRCGIYHPCTPCENCSNAVDGCGVAGINQSQGFDTTYQGGIPWPPPDGTCPCKPCDLLCLEEVNTFFWAKAYTYEYDGVLYYSNDPVLPWPKIQSSWQDASVWQVGGTRPDTYFIRWRCNSPETLENSDAPLEVAATGWSCGPSENGIWPSGPVPEGGEDELFPFRAQYWRVRVTPDCCDCNDRVITPNTVCEDAFYNPGDEYAIALACGGLEDVNNDYMGAGIQFPSYEGYTNSELDACPTPIACGTVCWEKRVEVNCNPFP